MCRKRCNETNQPSGLWCGMRNRQAIWLWFFTRKIHMVDGFQHSAERQANTAPEKVISKIPEEPGRRSQSAPPSCCWFAPLNSQWSLHGAQEDCYFTMNSQKKILAKTKAAKELHIVGCHLSCAYGICKRQAGLISSTSSWKPSVGRWCGRHSSEVL